MYIAARHAIPGHRYTRQYSGTQVTLSKWPGILQMYTDTLYDK